MEHACSQAIDHRHFVMTSHILRGALVAMALMANGAAAHDGHDNGKQAKAPLTSSTASRLEATSGPFELVAVLSNGALLIYLDRFDTNAPVEGATIAVETPEGPMDALAEGSVYRVSARWAQPGSHNLIFTVTVDDVTEILTGTLVVPQTADTAQSRRMELPVAAGRQGWPRHGKLRASCARCLWRWLACRSSHWPKQRDVGCSSRDLAAARARLGQCARRTRS